MKSVLVLIAIVILLNPSLYSAENSEKELKELFSKRGVEGTILITSLKGDKIYSYNKKRAAERFIPASTFKIPNSIIALETGAVKSETELIKWNGKKHGYNQWNRDHTLETALPVSCVWFYQELARRVGTENYKKILKKIAYGNMNPGPVVDTFWLTGDLRISAEEQIKFLKKFYHNKLPFSKKHMDIVKKILIVKKGDNFIIRAKTGWAVFPEKQYGWYVGYVEKKDNVWFFALNIDFNKSSDNRYRKEIVMEALGKLGIIN